MSVQLVCRRCEHQGFDVQSRIVEVAEPEARCVDVTECDERYFAAREEPEK